MSEQMPLTLRRRVLAALRAAGDRGACLLDVEPDARYTLRNRVGELRQEGHVIRSESCHAHRHRSGVRRYVLVVPPQPGQQQGLEIGELPHAPMHRDPTVGDWRQR